jgi:hypothetical protein
MISPDCDVASHGAYPAELLDFEMDELARVLPLIAPDRLQALNAFNPNRRRTRDLATRNSDFTPCARASARTGIDPLTSRPVGEAAERCCGSVSSNSSAAKRDPILYALETDWPVGAGGFEPLHRGCNLLV